MQLGGVTLKGTRQPQEEVYIVWGVNSVLFNFGRKMLFPLFPKQVHSRENPGRKKEEQKDVGDPNRLGSWGER